MNYIEPIIKKDARKQYKSLVKHNHLVQGKYSLPASEQKLLYKLFEEIQQNGYTSRSIKIKFQDLYTKYKQILSRNLSKTEFKQMLENLQDKKTYIIKGDTYIRTQWFAIIGKIDLSEFTIVIDEYVFQYVQALDGNFTKLRLETLYAFNSFYSMRIYELLKQWYLSKNEIPYKVDTLKELLGLEERTEVKNGKERIINKGYRSFTNFESKIIKPAIDEINEKSEIKVTYKKVKNGRKIDGISFKVEPKNKDVEVVNNNENDDPISPLEKLPNELKITEDVKSVFAMDFGDVDFSNAEVLFLLLETQTYILEKDNIKNIGVKSYKYFKTILRSKIDKYLEVKKENELLEQISEEEHEEWMTLFSTMTLSEFVEFKRGMDKN